jgi:hypothetical protein
VDVGRAARHDEVGIGEHLRCGLGHRNDSDIERAPEPGSDGVGNLARIAVHRLIDHDGTHGHHPPYPYQVHLLQLSWRRSAGAGRAVQTAARGT